MPLSERLARVEEICGYQFQDKQLLRCAITHPSAVEGQPVSSSYERLEFLGDSILGSIVALALYKSYPTFDEGKLTRLKVSLVSGMTLSDVGLSLASIRASSLVRPRRARGHVASIPPSKTCTRRLWVPSTSMVAGMWPRPL